MSAKKIPDQWDPEKIGRGLAGIAKEIVEKDKQSKKSMNTERTHTEHIENTKQTHFKRYKKTDLETFSIRLQTEDKRKLQRYFQSRDIGLSQGIRIIIKDFMERKGI